MIIQLVLRDKPLILLAANLSNTELGSIWETGGGLAGRFSDSKAASDTQASGFTVVPHRAVFLDGSRWVPN
jgi:hypothetical protein